jgi:hypothetical protein
MSRHFGLFTLSLAALIAAPVAGAAVPVLTAPEIDPASAVSALSLLVGSVLVLRGRRRAK